MVMNRLLSMIIAIILDINDFKNNPMNFRFISIYFKKTLLEIVKNENFVLGEEW